MALVDLGRVWLCVEWMMELERIDPGILPYLKTQFRLMQENCERISKRLGEKNPRIARDFKVMAETWESCAEIIEELSDPGTENGVPSSRKITSHQRYQMAIEGMILHADPDSI